MTTLKKILLTLPDETVDILKNLKGDQRNAYMAALRDAGWTYQSIAEGGTGLTRERVRQITLGDTIKPELAADLPVPTPPAKTEKPKAVYNEPKPEDLARMLELKPIRAHVRANSTAYRKEAEEYVRLINKANVEDGVPIYRLALRLGVSYSAVRFLLVRYGYKTSKTGKSKAFTPIDPKNRVMS
jgi:hypothetical protein